MTEKMGASFLQSDKGEGTLREQEQHETSIAVVDGIPMPSFCDHKRWDSLRVFFKT